MILPEPAPQYDMNDQAQVRRLIIQEFDRVLKRSGILLIGKGSLVLTAPNGSLWQVKVDNAGALSAVAYTLP